MNYRNIRIVIYALISLLLLVGCNKKNNNQESILESIFIEKNFECNKELELYYTDSNDVKYYTMCLNKIILKFNNKEIELKEELKNNKEIMNEIINKLTQTDLLYDGGTSIYKDFGYSNVAYSSFGNTSFTIIKCNAKYNEGNVITYNKDYYFGDSILDYENDYCSNK